MLRVPYYMIILGIDPGFGRVGYGVVKKSKVARSTGSGQVNPKSKVKELVCLDYGLITTSPKLSFCKRLEQIHEDLILVIKKYKPEVVAVEKLFFAKNVKTAIDVGQARGVVILTAIESQARVVEFTPLQVKQALVGYGRAEKQQVAEMVKIILELKETPKSDDAADALAVAITATRSQ